MNEEFLRIPKEALRLYYQVIDHVTGKRLDIVDVAYLTQSVFSALIQNYQHDRRINWEMASQLSMYDNLWSSEE